MHNSSSFLALVSESTLLFLIKIMQNGVVHTRCVWAFPHLKPHIIFSSTLFHPFWALLWKNFNVIGKALKVQSSGRLAGKQVSLYTHWEDISTSKQHLLFPSQFSFQNRLIMFSKLLFLHPDSEDSARNHFIMRRHQHSRHTFMESVGLISPECRALRGR